MQKMLNFGDISIFVFEAGKGRGVHWFAPPTAQHLNLFHIFPKEFIWFLNNKYRLTLNQVENSRTRLRRITKNQLSVEE